MRTQNIRWKCWLKNQRKSSLFRYLEEVHMERLSYGHTYNLQIAQAERVFGELRALVAMNYDLAKGGNSEQYHKMKKMVDEFIEEFRMEFC